MDKAKFFASVRSSLFGGSLTGDQVKGIESILNEWIKGGYDDERRLAYILATAHHETGAKFIASVENLNYSVEGLMKTFGRHRISETDARKFGRSAVKAADQQAIANIIYGGKWGADNLGNTQAGDGSRFIGRGFVQITGRANYAKYGLTDNPASAANTDVAARVAVDGMVNGRFTGLKLAQFFDHDSDDPVGARKIINPDKNGAKIATDHRKYLSALKLAGV